MARRRCIVTGLLKVYREGFGLRTMRPNEELWAETPLDSDKVLVYLDNVEFWTYRKEFDALTRPYSSDPL